MATLGSFGLGLYMLVAAFITMKCVTPPNPPPVKPNVQDRAGWMATQSRAYIRRNSLLLVWLYHTLLTISYPNPSPIICPHPDRLDPKLFSWSAYTMACLTAILIAGNIRLAAFRQLGEDFTFQLATPKKLVKHGLYSYLQHPSYLGHLVSLSANVLLLIRRGGGVSCWLPDTLGMKYLGIVFWIAYVGITGYAGWLRIQDEEDMLKREFGKEWEEYHARTKRLIPGLF